MVEATSAPPVKIVARLGFLKAERHAVPRIHGVDAEKRCVHRLAMAPKSMQSTSQKHVAGADEQQKAAFQVAFSRALATDDPRWSSLGSPRKLTDAVGRSPVGEGAERMNSPRRSATTPRGCRADAVGKLPGGVGVGRRISPRTSVATPRGCRIDDLDNFVITPRPRPPPCANPPWGLVDFCEVFFVKRNRRGGLHGDRCRGREDMTELQRRAFRWVVVTSRLVCGECFWFLLALTLGFVFFCHGHHFSSICLCQAVVLSFILYQTFEWIHSGF